MGRTGNQCVKTKTYLEKNKGKSACFSAAQICLAASLTRFGAQKR
jgi:hypothetical protein